MQIAAYPPPMPLYDGFIRHARSMESRWASPVAYLPMLILGTLLFLGGLWVLTQTMVGEGFSFISPPVAMWVFSLTPPAVLIGVVFLQPLLSSPVWAYYVSLARSPNQPQLRWNLAVVATAHLYYGQVAQTEWLSQLPHLTETERQQAYDYIRRVRRNLQKVPVLTTWDLLATVCAGLVIAMVPQLFSYNLIDGLLHGIALMVAMQLLMLHLLVQRWQHTRRLMDLEEVFEELLPQRAAALPSIPEDEVQRWYRESRAPQPRVAPAPAAPATPQEAPSLRIIPYRD